MSKIRKAQISIDYIGGAIVFFIAILFIVTTTLNVVPRFSDNLEHNRLQVTGWTISTTLLDTPGYWENDDEDGEDWYEYIFEGSGNQENLKSIGLEDMETGGLDRDKIESLGTLIDYTDMREIMSTDFEFHIDFTEYVIIDTSKDGDSDEEPEPGGSWGYEIIRGEGYYFYVVEETDGYTVHVGEEDGQGIDFFEEVEQGESVILELGEDDEEFLLDVTSGGILKSGGDLLVLEKDLRSVGRDIHLSADEMVNIRRFSNIDDNIVRIDMRIWEP